MIRIISILFICTFVPLPMLAQSPESFFPSQVGNLWQYQGDILWMDWSITNDSLASNGDKFLFTIGKPFLYRLDTLFNVYERYSNGSEDHSYDLDADSGDVWIYGSYYAWVAGVDSVLVFGESTARKIIRYGPEYPDSNWSNFYYVEQHLASGFGLIYQWEEPGYVAFLRGCIVNGDTFGIVVSVPDSHTELPATTILLQNYPNPFNSTTTIEYNINQRGLVRLQVIDILGREVATLVESVQEPGQYRMNFIGTSLASGVYLYRIETPNGIQMKQMLLMK